MRGGICVLRNDCFLRAGLVLAGKWKGMKKSLRAVMLSEAKHPLYLRPQENTEIFFAYRSSE